MLHWDGFEFEQICLPLVYLNGFFVNKLWGTTSSNLFGVGNNGFILHYNGSQWQPMASGTEVDLQDVWGTADGSVVWACGVTNVGPTALLRFTDGAWEVVYEEGVENQFTIRQDSLSGIVKSVWTNDSGFISILTQAGLYIAPGRTQGEGVLRPWFVGSSPGFPGRLRGQGLNDLFIVGDRTMVMHYNGASWRFYSEIFRLNSRLFSLDVVGDEVFAVGTDWDGKAVVYHGKR